MNDQRFSPGTAVEPTSSVEISISCRDLLDKDVFSRSDPMCVVYHQPFGITQWVELLRTEVIWDCLNPDFVTKLILPYRFEEVQLMRFEVYDIDNESKQLESHDFLGCSETTLGQIVSAGYNGLSQQLVQHRSKYYPMLGKKIKKCQGIIIIYAEELRQLKEEITLQIEGNSMSQRFLWVFPPKVFFTVSKINESGNYIVIHKSEAKNGENPKWNPITMSMNRLCNGDRDRVLKVQCWREGINGYHKDLGMFITTFNKIEEGVGNSFHLVGKNGSEKTRQIILKQLKINRIHTFVEYIAGGTQIHCNFAIDFTASNKDPNDPTSLHYFSNMTDRSNPYEQAIQSVGDIIQDYTETKNFPVYGFGAKVPPEGNVSHIFPVNFNSESPHCVGIPGVLEAYRNCIRRVQLAGPTNFAPLISNIAIKARENLTGEHYYVLLIITDGIINDMPLTKEAIVNASTLPLSIIIVGVGNANFDAMDELDGDIVRVSYCGKLASRDIVQFVNYRDAYSWLALSCPHINEWSSSLENKNQLAKMKLAQEVLAEIPEQLTSFMKSRGIEPLRKISI